MGQVRFAAAGRARLGLACVVTVLAAAVAVHHTGAFDSHAIHEAPELALCLAVVGGAAALATRRRPPVSPIQLVLAPARRPPPAGAPLPVPVPRIRAGPPLLQVFRL